MTPDTDYFEDAVRVALVRNARAGRTVSAPVPADLPPRLNPLPGIRLLMCDVYGTLITSASGDENAPAQAQPDWPVLFRDAGIPLRRAPDAAAADEEWRALIRNARERRHAEGADVAEVEIREVVRAWLASLQARGFLDAVPDAARLEDLWIRAEAVRNPCAVMPGMEDALDRMARAGLRFGVLSNAQFYTPPLLAALAPRIWTPRVFDSGLLVWSFEHGLGKPSARLFDRAAGCVRRRGYAPGEVALIGNDVQNDLLPARRAGWRTVLFAGDRRSLRLRDLAPEAVPAAADAVVTHWSQVPALLGA